MNAVSSLFIITIQIMDKILCAFLLLLPAVICTAKKASLPEPSPSEFADEVQQISLAQNETFILPITTRTITHRLEMLPQNTGECEFTSQSMIYHSLSSASLFSDEQDNNFNVLALSKKEKLFLIDQEHSITSYSLDQHYLLKRLAPKSAFAGLSSKVSTLTTVATEDEQYVYLLTPQKYYIFKAESLGQEILHEAKLPGQLKDVQKAIIYKNNLLLLSAQAGLLIYKIDKSSKVLALAQRFKYDPELTFADMQFQAATEMLYVQALNRALIKVYHYEPSEFPNYDKSLTIFIEYDALEIDSVTNRHKEGSDLKNIHMSIEISRGRQEQTLMVLFLHNYHYVIAEILYDIDMQTWFFVRYYKFTFRVNEIHIIKDVVAVVGKQTIGLFPFGIHPRLIDQEFNGVMSLTSIFKLKILPNGRFIGLTKSTVEYGVIRLEQKAELVCKIQPESKLKSVKLKANLTACSNEQTNSYTKYCAYQKTFNLQEMQLAVSAPVADSLWTAMLIFLMLIILGICILYAIQQRKEREIRRLQQYFEQKKKAPPAESDRRTLNYM